MIVAPGVEPKGQSVADSDAAIFREMYKALRGFAAVVGNGNCEPDDLVQEVLERTLRHHRLSDLDQPLAYLRKAIYHQALNDQRSEARAQQALSRLQFLETGPATYPSDLADLFRLPPADRAVLYLVYVEGNSLADVARLLDLSYVATRARASRAQRRFASIMRGE